MQSEVDIELIVPNITFEVDSYSMTTKIERFDRYRQRKGLNVVLRANIIGKFRSLKDYVKDFEISLQEVSVECIQVLYGITNFVNKEVVILVLVFIYFLNNYKQTYTTGVLFSIFVRFQLERYENFGNLNFPIRSVDVFHENFSYVSHFM